MFSSSREGRNDLPLPHSCGVFGTRDPGIYSRRCLTGRRLFLLPLVFFYGALAVPPPGMLLLALTGGFMWDALVATQVVDGNLEISLGWSIVLYAALGAIMSGFRPLFQRGHGWEIHCLLSGPLLCLFVIVRVSDDHFSPGQFHFPKNHLVAHRGRRPRRDDRRAIRFPPPSLARPWLWLGACPVRKGNRAQV